MGIISSHYYASTRWFYNVRVSGTPVTRLASPGRTVKRFYNWDDVLKDYLSETETSAKA